MNNEKFKMNLKKLKEEENILLEKHKNKHFANDIEAEKYIEENKVELERLNEIQKEIKKLEWQLMSETEKQEYLEYQKKIKEKYSDD